MAADSAPTTPVDFARQLLTQLYGDLDRVLSVDGGTAPIADAYGLVGAAVAQGSQRGASFHVLLQAAMAVHRALVHGDPDLELPDPQTLAAALTELVPDAAPHVAALSRHATRLIRYTAEAEPNGRALPVALALAIHQLYDGLLRGDRTVGTRGLVSLRTLLAHCDAVAAQLDPAAEDRPVRVLPPDRFHDYFMQLTEQVQQAGDGRDRPVAALTKDGRLTAVIAEEDHPLQAAAAVIRERIPGDPTSKEHALLRMQGLLRVLDDARADAAHPLVAALHDQGWYLAVVTAAATTPMQTPGRFGLPALCQISRYNHNLLQERQPES